MTIKQQGGIFGRNPTFNEVDVDNDLSVGSDLLYVDVSAGKVGINTNTPGARLSGSILNIDDASVSGIELSNSGSSATEIFADGSKTVISERRSGSIVFRTSGTNERMNIGAGGDVTVNTGNLIIGTSGKGIDFSATSGTGTSELFDDYEEGTWTPTLTTSGTDFGSVTYDAQTAGSYTKIGRMVYFKLRLFTDAITVGSASGNVQIDGLPFSASLSSAVPVGYSSLWTTNQPTHGLVLSGTSKIGLYYRAASNTTSVELPYTNARTSTNSNLAEIAGCYETA